MANVLGELFGDIATAIRSKTGEEGTMKPAEFPAKIKSIGETVIYELEEVSGFAFDSSTGSYTPGLVFPSAFSLGEGKTYRVNWEGADYECASFTFDMYGYTFVGIGNASSLGLQGNGEPFFIMQNITEDYTQIFATDDKDAHTVGIYTTVAGQSGGGVSDDLRYVTFMSYDGTVEYGKKAVATGDDCADPIARGIFDTPTRESNAQYSYTFSGGWATTPNGGKDANALKAVTEDRTVYANFVSAVRYYTITFYDSDGTTVLTTKSVAYGSMPSYTPEKEGYSFVSWDRDLEAVTGDASYTANWSEKLSFANSTWADIARVSEAGEAANHFAIGDERVVTIDGEAVTLVIVGINADRLKSGSSKGITIVNKNAYTTSTVSNPMKKNTLNAYDYFASDISTTVDGLLSKFPSDLQSVVKSAIKYGTDSVGNMRTAYLSVWLLSCRELTSEFELGLQSDSWLKKPYEGFTKFPSLLSYDGIYWLRTFAANNYWQGIEPSKVTTYISNKYSPYSQLYYNNKNLIRFGFCI